MSHHTYADEMINLSRGSKRKLPLNIRTNWKAVWEESFSKNIDPTYFYECRPEFQRIVRKHTVRLK